MQQVVRTAVKRRRSHNVVTGLAERHQSDRRRCLARGDCERSRQTDSRHATPFKRIDPRFERSLRRVHDARIDVADLGEREQVRGMFGVAELVRSRLIDRHSPRTAHRGETLHAETRPNN